MPSHQCPIAGVANVQKGGKCPGNRPGITSKRRLFYDDAVTYFLFRGTTFHLVLCTENMEFLTSSHSAVSNTLHLDVV